MLSQEKKINSGANTLLTGVIYCETFWETVMQTFVLYVFILTELTIFIQTNEKIICDLENWVMAIHIWNYAVPYYTASIWCEYGNFFYSWLSVTVISSFLQRWLWWPLKLGQAQSYSTYNLHIFVVYQCYTHQKLISVY